MNNNSLKFFDFGFELDLSNSIAHHAERILNKMQNPKSINKNLTGKKSILQEFQR